MAQTDKNTIIFALLMLVVTLFVTANLPENFNVGVIYSIMAIFSVAAYLALKVPSPGIEFRHQTDWLADIGFGVLIGAVWAIVATIAKGSLFSIAFEISIPRAFAIGAFLGPFVILVFAPIIETLAFEGAFRKLLVQFSVPMKFTVPIVAFLFSSFHLYAYTQGSYYAVTKPFISAFMFSIIAGTMVLWRNNLLPAMVFHGIVNAYVLFQGMSQ